MHMKKLFLLPALFLSFFTSHATHIKGGELTAKGTGTLHVYEITLTLYLDSISVANSGGALDENTAMIVFGDGSSADVSYSTKTYIGQSVLKQTYVVNHSYSGTTLYTISYYQTNRNKYIVNIDGKAGDSSDLIPFFVSATINTSIFDEAGTPQLTSNYPGNAVPGVIFNFASTAVPAVQGDSISYKIVAPQSAVDEDVPAYVSPADPSFGGSSNASGTPTFQISPSTGLLVWDTPSNYKPSSITYALYNVGILVTEWRKNSGNYVAVGSTVRDIIIKVAGAPTAVLPAFANEILLFPNPVASSFQLSSEQKYFDNAELSVYSSQGQLLKKIPLNDLSQQFSMEDLKAGVYQVKVSDGKHSWQKTLVKQ